MTWESFGDGDDDDDDDVRDALIDRAGCRFDEANGARSRSARRRRTANVSR